MAESMYGVQYHLKHLIPHYSKSSQLFFFPSVLFKTAKMSLCLYARVNIQIFLQKLHVSDLWTVQLAHAAAKQAEGKKNLYYLTPFLFFTYVSRIILLLLSWTGLLAATAWILR